MDKRTTRRRRETDRAQTSNERKGQDDDDEEQDADEAVAGGDRGGRESRRRRRGLRRDTRGECGRDSLAPPAGRSRPRGRRPGRASRRLVAMAATLACTATGATAPTRR